VSRDQILLWVGVLIVFGAIFFVRKEYQLSSATQAAAAQQAQASVPDPEPFSASDAAVLFDQPATEQMSRDLSPEHADIIAHAKNAPVSMLDSSLPHQSAGYWVAHAAGPSAGLRWEVNNCPGARKQAHSRPVCVEAMIKFFDGTKFNAQLLVGEQPLNPVGPVRYGQPSLLWAAYKKVRGALVPAPLSLLPQIAQEAD
jgi:hypothetical protein